jgi:hypothetical protein
MAMTQKCCGDGWDEGAKETPWKALRETLSCGPLIWKGPSEEALGLFLVLDEMRREQSDTDGVGKTLFLSEVSAESLVSAQPHTREMMAGLLARTVVLSLGLLM